MKKICAKILVFVTLISIFGTGSISSEVLAKTKKPTITKKISVNVGKTKKVKAGKKVVEKKNDEEQLSEITPTPTPTITPEPIPIGTYDFASPKIDINGNITWDCIYFGNYWQEDTNGDGLANQKDDKQPIKWRVLEVTKTGIFIISNKCLDLQKFDDREYDTMGERTWESSTIRQWLNQDFYNTAFDETERAEIQLVTMSNKDENGYYKQENDTTDKIALISREELSNESYCLENDKSCSATTYAGEGENEWYTRSLFTEGWIASGDGNSGISGGLIEIRPVLYLNLSATSWSKAEVENSLGQDDEFDEMVLLPNRIEPKQEEIAFDETKVVHEGVDGDITWKIDANGCLLLEGEGDYEGLGEYLGLDGCPAWTDYYDEIITAKVNVSGITNAKYMFYYCTNLRQIDFSGIDTSLVTDMSYMFQDCFSLCQLDLSSFDTLNVTDMAYMFDRCENLQKIDITSFDASNVLEMDYMFGRCKSLTDIDLSKMNATKVQDMFCMFLGCTNLEKLDLSAFDLSNLTDNEKEIFDMSELDNLVEIKTPKNLQSCAFVEDRRGDVLNKAELPAWTKNTTAWKSQNGNIVKVFPFERESSITLTRKKKIESFEGIDGDLKWSVDVNGQLTISGTGNYNEPEFYYPKWHQARLYIKSCVVDVTGITNTSYMFGDLPYLESITFEKFDTSNVTDMLCMFDGTAIQSLNLSCFDTSKVKNMTAMFRDCKELTYVDVSSFNTKMVTDMSMMFDGCRKVEELELSNFETDNITEILWMFRNCSKLQRIDCKEWNTEKMEYIQEAFKGCYSLEKLDLSSWDLKCLEESVYYYQDFLECMNSLVEIKTPKNLVREVILPVGTWVDENGIQYTNLPTSQTESVLLKKTPTTPTPTPTVTPTPTPTVQPTINPEPNVENTKVSIKAKSGYTCLYTGNKITSKYKLTKKGVLTWKRGSKTKKFTGVKSAGFIKKSKNLIFVTKKGKVFTVSGKGKKKTIVKKGAKKLVLKNKFVTKVKTKTGSVNVTKK